MLRSRRNNSSRHRIRAIPFWHFAALFTRLLCVHRSREPVLARPLADPLSSRPPPSLPDSRTANSARWPLVLVPVPPLFRTSFSVLERLRRCRAPPSRPPGRTWDGPEGKAPTGYPHRREPRLVSARFQICWTRPVGMCQCYGANYYYSADSRGASTPLFRRKCRVSGNENGAKRTPAVGRRFFFSLFRSPDWSGLLNVIVHSRNYKAVAKGMAFFDR